MNNKKHIDRLFQEKFKDFEMKPDAKVWANIERQLETPKRSRRIIPIWLRYIGAAAVLLLFLTIGNFYLNTNTEINGTVVDNTEDTLKSTLEEDHAIIAKEENNFHTTQNTATASSTGSAESKSIENNQLELANSDNLKDLNKNTKEYTSKTAPNNKNTAVVSHYNTSTSKPSTKTGKTTSNHYTNKASNTISYFNNNTRNPQNNNTLYTGKQTKQNTINNKHQKTNNSSTTITNVDTKTTKNNNKTSIPNVDQNNIISQNKTGSYVAYVTKDNTVPDNTPITENKNNVEDNGLTIEETIAQNEAVIEKENTPSNRWNVSTNAAPVYYNTLGNGSHIDEQFANNKKEGKTNISYGVKVGYAVNKKLKVRSGVNKLNLSYDTANAVVYNPTSDSNSSVLKNIAYTQDFGILNTDNFNTLNLESKDIDTDTIDSNGLINDEGKDQFDTENDGITYDLFDPEPDLTPAEPKTQDVKQLSQSISQRISYVEVPVELEYALINKKIGVNVIGGASIFILENNEIVTDIDNKEQKIGEANNIKDFSYSANIGLGIDYNFSNNLKLHVEPTFKYQMNGYNKTSGDFKPYIIGVYSGFNYKF